MTGEKSELKRPVTADVVILSSQAWRQSFLGFVKVRPGSISILLFQGSTLNIHFFLFIVKLFIRI